MQKKNLKSENETLKTEIDELKNGSSRQLEQIRAASNDQDWEKTVSLADKLHETFPGTADDEEGQQLKQTAQQKIREIAAQKKAAEEEAARQKAEEEARGYETGITFDQLARTPDDFIGKKVKFTGKVIQVSNGTSETQIRLAIDGDYDRVILAYYEPSIVKSKVLDDDYITIYGVSKGDYTYESVMGASITVPLVAIDKIDQ